jgi:hypothetical protein
MRKSFLYVLLIALTGLLQSCQGYSDGRMLKKFISRFNAGEYSCAAAYVYPGDRMNLAFFAKEVKKLAPNAFVKLEDYDTEKTGEDRYIDATLKWENATPALETYFRTIGYPLNKEGTQKVKLRVRDTNDGETISFAWGIPNVLSDNLWIASTAEKDGKPLKEVALYDSPSEKANVVSKMEHDLIVQQEGESNWLPVYEVDNNGNVKKSYMQKSEDITLDRTAYFTMGIFDSMGLILALIIIIVIAVPVYFLGSIAQSIFSLNPLLGVVICIGLILGVLYVIYQLLEKILFELFIINLPY